MSQAAVYEVEFVEPPPPRRGPGSLAAATTRGAGRRRRRLPSRVVAPDSHRPHGTYVKYVVERCGCEPCRLANRAYERWGKGGLTLRCDGVRCLTPALGGMLEQDCRCAARGLAPHDDKDKGACVATARIRVVLPDVAGVGIWLCTSHSMIATSELGAQATLLEALGDRLPLVPASLAIEPRSFKKSWEPYERHVFVPVVRVAASLAQLEQVAALDPAERPLLALGMPAPGSGPAPPEQAPDAGATAPEAPITTTVADAGPTPPDRPLFSEADELFVDIAWREQFRQACADASLDAAQVHRVVSTATGGRTTDPAYVHKTEIEAVRRAYRELVEGQGATTATTKKG